MLPVELLRQLRLILATLYTEEASARRVISDAGLDDRFIDFSPRSIDNWHAILQEAQKQPALLDGLLQVVQAEYPENLQLRAVVVAYQQQSGQQVLDLSTLLTAYWQRLVQETSSLLLPGLARHASGTPTLVRLELAEIYTSLDTLHLLETDEVSDDTPAQRQSALSFINQHRYCVLLGEPGAGKTVFANFVTLCLAGAQLGLVDTNLKRLGPEWTHGVLCPLYIPARGLVAQATDLKRQPLADPLWHFIVTSIGLEFSDYATRFTQQLAAEGGIVIIDGFDEIPIEQQRHLHLPIALEALRQRLPGVRILLTSRPYAYPQIQADLAGFAIATVAPFSARQIATFIRQWHRPEVAPVPPGADLAALADRLRQVLGAYPSLQEVAVRPLLLTLLTTLHTLQPTALPIDQVQIFEESIEWLLTVWEHSKALPTKPVGVQLSHGEARRVMEKLAYMAQARQHVLEKVADITEKEFVSAILDTNQDLDLRPRRIIEYIRSRTGLLRERSPKLYSFPHRAIQEYLAACYLLTDTEQRAELVRLTRQRPERWREVVLWAGRKLATVEPTAIWWLTSQLCPTAATGSAEEATSLSTPDGLLLTLAGRLVAEVRATLGGDFNAEQTTLLQRLRHDLVQVVTAEQWSLPERVSAGATLGHLGDPRSGVGVDPVRQLPALDWALIEPGPFLLGSEPLSVCTQIEQPYQISRYPITVAQYQTFVAAGGYTQRKWWTAAGWSWRRYGAINAPQAHEAIFQTPNHPQVGVSWYEAVAFCRWLSGQLGQLIELPTEFQWERAARHVDGRTYPWGNEFSPYYCNSRATGLGVTTPVGLFTNGNSVAGAADLAGNVWEWCRTTWCSQLSDYTPAADLDLEDAVRRALRGGSFGNLQRFVRCANRERNHPDHRAYNIGFRVVGSAV